MRMQALDGFDAHHALMLAFVRQHRRAPHVADRVDPGHVGLAEAVDDDAAAFGLDAELFQPRFSMLRRRRRRKSPVEFDRLRLSLPSSDGGDHAVALLLEFCHLGINENLDALFSNALCANFENLGISTRRICGSTSTTVTSAPMVWEERRELDSDGAGADHQQRLGILSGTIAFE